MLRQFFKVYGIQTLAGFLNCHGQALPKGSGARDLRFKAIDQALAMLPTLVQLFNHKSIFFSGKNSLCPPIRAACWHKPVSRFYTRPWAGSRQNNTASPRQGLFCVRADRPARPWICILSSPAKICLS